MEQDLLEKSIIISELEGILGICYIDYKQIQKNVFQVQGQDIYIGKLKVSEQLKGILSDQATNFKTTNLYDILDATISEEASRLALVQSANWDHVQYAKALHHWNHVMKNLIHSLSKK